MHPDVGALLAVQDDDVNIRQLENQLAQLGPQLDALAREKDAASALLEQATQTADTEERRRHEVAARVAQHRTLQEKNQATLNSVTSMREATAATAQLEQAKRMIDEDERELAAIGQRLVAARKLAEERSHVVADLEVAQAEKLNSLSADRETLESQIAEARAVRDAKATAVPAQSALDVRSDSPAETGTRRLSAARPVVRQLRYDDSLATPKLDGRKRRHRDL